MFYGIIEGQAACFRFQQGGSIPNARGGSTEICRGKGGVSLRAEVGPDYGIVEGIPSAPVPQDGSLPLVCDACRNDTCFGPCVDPQPYPTDRL